jgi:C4-dicarboxylate-specific signal transduction histidine kinase
MFSTIVSMMIENTTLIVLVIFTLLLIGAAIYAMVNSQKKIRLMQRHYEEELSRRTKDQTEKLFSHSKYTELGMMSAGIAHEINNPLAVIQARTSQLLRIYRQPDRQQDMGEGLQQILYTSERINRTIQGIREFIHHGDNLSDGEMEVQEIIDDVLAFCGQRMKNHGVNLRFYNLENKTVVGNKIQLEQILLNLLNNAFDAIEFLPDKWIEISLQEDDEKVELFVKDSGSGIPKDIAEHVMEPFFSTKDIGKGTGLGLALARGIAQKHGGDLTYIEGAHTTFMLELPKPLARNRAWEKMSEYRPLSEGGIH